MSEPASDKQYCEAALTTNVIAIRLVFGTQSGYDQIARLAACRFYLRPTRGEALKFCAASARGDYSKPAHSGYDRNCASERVVSRRGLVAMCATMSDFARRSRVR